MTTVIIPTYNNEETIERAILSVMGQSDVNWKLLIVDDCSTDRTSDIISNYLSDNRISVIRNQENVGAGVSRKVGLDACDTEFVTFLDSDDFLKPDFLKMSLMLQAQHDSDVVYTSFTVMYPQGVVNVIPSGDFIMEGEATPQLHFSQQLKFLTGKIFRKSLLDKIVFSPKRVGEDVQTLFFATYLADKVRSSSYSGYVHMFREGSLLADKPYDYCFLGSTLAEQEIIDFLIERNDERLWKYLLTNSVNTYRTVMEKAKEGKDIKMKDLKKHKEWFRAVSTWYNTHRKYIAEIGL